MTNSPTQLVELEISDSGIAHLRLNNGAKRNPLSMRVLSLLMEKLDEIADNETIGAVLLSAEGPAFCAGHDLKELQAHRQDEQFIQDLFSLCSIVMTRIVKLPKPVIALVDGMATAAGCQLVASADLAYATPLSEFGTPGVKIGLFCSTPMVALSRKVGRNTAMEMLLTGKTLSAERAQRCGLINDVVSPEDLMRTGYEVAENIASFSHRTLAIGKEAFYHQAELELDDAYAFTSKVMAKNMALPDAHEGISAFLEKRTPQWRKKHG